ncbi:MAG: hypothetical protein AAB725_01415 [Patescibacteria group bacterium]
MDNVSLIPKKETSAYGLPKFGTFQKPEFELSALAKIGLVLVGLILVFSGGLHFWKYRLTKEIASFNGELQKLTSQRDMSLEARLNNLNSVLEVFKNVLDDHRYWSQVFKMLEEKTLNTVTFKSFDVSEKENSILFTGAAPSYGVLAQQVKILEGSPNVIAVASSNINLGETGKVNFNLRVDFSKDLITRK